MLQGVCVMVEEECACELSEAQCSWAPERIKHLVQALFALLTCQFHSGSRTQDPTAPLSPGEMPGLEPRAVWLPSYAPRETSELTLRIQRSFSLFPVSKLMLVDSDGKVPGEVICSNPLWQI